MTPGSGPPPGDVEAVLDFAGDPGRGPSPPLVVLLAGVPGSGKSTLARQVAPHIPAAIVSSDDVRRALVDRARYSRAESARVFAAIHAAIAQLIASGRSVILDATSAFARDRAPVIDLAHAADARLLIVHVTAPEEIVLERLRRRTAAADPLDRSEAGEAVYHRIAARFEPITQPHLRLDTSTRPGEAAERLLREIASEHPGA